MPKIERWRRAGDVFAYFNNDWRGFAVSNALALADMLGVRRGEAAASSPIATPCR